MSLRQAAPCSKQNPSLFFSRVHLHEQLTSFHSLQGRFFRKRQVTRCKAQDFLHSSHPLPLASCRAQCSEGCFSSMAVCPSERTGQCSVPLLGHPAWHGHPAPRGLHPGWSSAWSVWGTRSVGGPFSRTVPSKLPSALLSLPCAACQP